MTKRDLEHIHYLNERIKQKAERIGWMKQRAFPTSPRISPDKTATPTVFDPLGDIFAEIDIEERKLNKLIDQYADERQAAIKAISKLPTRRERNILYLRYIAMLSWDDVEKCMNKRDKLSRVTIFRLHNQAIARLERDTTSCGHGVDK